MSDAFTKALAAASAATGAPAPKPQTPAAPPPPVAAPAPADHAAAAASALELELDPSDEPSGEEQPTEEPRTALELAELKELLESGKLAELAELAGADKSKVTETGGRLRLATKREKEAKEAEARVDEKTEKLEARIKSGNARFAAAVALENAAAQQDWTGFAQNLVKYLPEGMTFGKLTQLVAQGSAPTTPNEERLTRKLAEIEKKLEAPKEKEKTPEEKKTADVATLTTKLAAHPGAALEDFAENVRLELLRDWDPVLKGYKSGAKALRKAADAVYARELAKAKKLVKVPAAPPRKPAPPPRVRDTDGKYVAPKAPTQRDPFAEAMAAAKRAASAGAARSR